MSEQYKQYCTHIIHLSYNGISYAFLWTMLRVQGYELALVINLKFISPDIFSILYLLEALILVKRLIYEKNAQSSSLPAQYLFISWMIK